MLTVRRVMPLTFSLGAVLTLAACGSKPAPPMDERAVQESVIRSADQECLQAVQSKTAEKVITCYTPQALWWVPGMPPAKGQDAILAAWRKFFLQSDFSMSWHTTQVVAARSGEIGYSIYDYRLTARLGPSKQPTTEHGTGLAIWKRQLDGKWKMAADMLSPSPTPQDKVANRAAH